MTTRIQCTDCTNGHTFRHIRALMGTPYDRGTDYWRCETCNATYSGDTKGWKHCPQGHIYPCMNPRKDNQLRSSQLIADPNETTPAPTSGRDHTQEGTQ